MVGIGFPKNREQFENAACEPRTCKIPNDLKPNEVQLCTF